MDTFQGGTDYVVFNPQGPKPLEAATFSGAVHKEYDKLCRSQVIILNNGVSQPAKCVLPREGRKMLLLHPFFVFQLYLGPSAPLTIELAVLDTLGRRRFILSTAFASVQIDPLHVKLPLQGLPRSVWFELAIDVHAVHSCVLQDAASGQVVKGVDGIVLSASGVCRVRKIYTLRGLDPRMGRRPGQRPMAAVGDVSCASELASCLPTVHALPDGIEKEVVYLRSGYELATPQTAPSQAARPTPPRTHPRSANTSKLRTDEVKPPSNVDLRADLPMLNPRVEVPIPDGPHVDGVAGPTSEPQRRGPSNDATMEAYCPERYIATSFLPEVAASGLVHSPNDVGATKNHEEHLSSPTDAGTAGHYDPSQQDAVLFSSSKKESRKHCATRRRHRKREKLLGPVSASESSSSEDAEESKPVEPHVTVGPARDGRRQEVIASITPIGDISTVDAETVRSCTNDSTAVALLEATTEQPVVQQPVLLGAQNNGAEVEAEEVVEPHPIVMSSDEGESFTVHDAATAPPAASTTNALAQDIEAPSVNIVTAPKALPLTIAELPVALSASIAPLPPQSTSAARQDRGTAALPLPVPQRSISPEEGSMKNAVVFRSHEEELPPSSHCQRYTADETSSSTTSSSQSPAEEDHPAQEQQQQGEEGAVGMEVALWKGGASALGPVSDVPHALAVDASDATPFPVRALNFTQSPASPTVLYPTPRTLVALQNTARYTYDSVLRCYYDRVTNTFISAAPPPQQQQQQQLRPAPSSAKQ